MEKQLPMTSTSHLRHLFALALASLLAACATHIEAPDQRADIPAVIAQVELPAAAASAPASAASAAAVAPGASAPADGGGPVAAAPVDPLRPEEPVDLESKAASIDLWERVRRGFAMPDLETSLVRTGEQWYSSRPDYVARMTERGSRYLFHIVEEVQRRGMPTELALLPFIESAFNPQAISSAKASGMWQFMPATGKNFDLRQNIFRDDRRNVLASTRAALDYLQKLHDMFGDWHLALAAYNWGEGSVSRAIARNRKAGLPTDYASLRMPAETRLYVPKLQAVKNIVAQPEAFGLTLRPIENHPYFLTVPIQRDIDVALVAQIAGLPLEEFHALNPSLNKPVILAAGTPRVLLPYDNADRFVRELPLHRGPLASWTAWVVPKTMRPADAARQFGMSEAQLREVNKIPPRMKVRAGSTLLVPRSERREADVPEQVADNATMLLVADVPARRRTVVRARRNDNVASIAARYGVSRANVAEWNKVATGARFKAGQSVVVYVPAKARTRTVRARSAAGRTASAARAPRKAVGSKASVAAKTRVASPRR
jgi:membrane-bound lytic murein transglycosylase D